MFDEKTHNFIYMIPCIYNELMVINKDISIIDYAGNGKFSYESHLKKLSHDEADKLYEIYINVNIKAEVIYIERKKNIKNKY